MNNIIEKNEFGFYNLKSKPTAEELQQYYTEKYYQQAKDNYEQDYSDEEVLYFKNKIEQKAFVAERIIKTKGEKSIIDIGCGEGWTLDYFVKKGWKVKGVDYSIYGCNKFNPHCNDLLIVGDIYGSLKLLLDNKEKFSVVWIDNVLEHVLDPLELLTFCKDLVDENGVIIVEVPNDYSILQNFLLENELVSKPYWIAIPDHISYFNKEGLLNLAKAVGLQSAFYMSDFPIDINLLNPYTNYQKDKNKGKACYQAKIAFENLIHSISVEKTVEFYRSMLEIGLGRQLVAFLVPNK